MTATSAATATATDPNPRTLQRLCSTHPTSCVWFWFSLIVFLVPGIVLWIFYWPIDAIHSLANVLRCVQISPVASPNCVGGSIFEVFVPNDKGLLDSTQICLYSSQYLVLLNSQEKSALVGCPSKNGIWFSTNGPPTSENTSFPTLHVAGCGIAMTIVGVVFVLWLAIVCDTSKPAPAPSAPPPEPGDA